MTATGLRGHLSLTDKALAAAGSRSRRSGAGDEGWLEGRPAGERRRSGSPPGKRSRAPRATDVLVQYLLPDNVRSPVMSGCSGRHRRRFVRLPNAVLVEGNKVSCHARDGAPRRWQCDGGGSRWRCRAGAGRAGSGEQVIQPPERSRTRLCGQRPWRRRPSNRPLAFSSSLASYFSFSLLSGPAVALQKNAN